jgi:hypothetical protein
MKWLIPHYPTCTGSIKRIQQFSCNFAVLNVSKGSLFSDFQRHNNRCEVLCGSRKSKLPHSTIQSVVIFFWSFRVPLKTVLKGVRDVALFSFPHVQSQSVSSIVMKFRCFNASNGSFFPDL